MGRENFCINNTTITLPSIEYNSAWYDFQSLLVYLALTLSKYMFLSWLTDDNIGYLKDKGTTNQRCIMKPLYFKLSYKMVCSIKLPQIEPQTNICGKYNFNKYLQQ